MLEDVKYLAAPLPEDIRRREQAGYFSKALNLIERRLEGELPLALRKRLELERELIPVWEEEYPYSFDAALKLLKEHIRDFTEEEFVRLIDEGVFDWIYREGGLYLICTFYENLLKVQHPLTGRLKENQDPKAGEEKQRVLNESMNEMKECGKTARRIHIRTTLTVREAARRAGQPITVHLPVPCAGTQVRNIKLLEVPPGAFIAPEEAESRTVCYQGPLPADGEFAVEYEYEIHMPYVDLWPVETGGDKAAAEEKTAAEELAEAWRDKGEPAFFLAEQAPHILFTSLIRSLYYEIVGDEKNPLSKARNIYDYITTHIRYSYVRKYSIIENIPEYAIINQKGDCGIQALLFITLCRLGGIPARWQSGLFAAPYDIGGHDWAQFYVAPHGWLYADLSFGGSSHRAGNEERRRFYFGNLDPYRMPANSAFQHEFDPPKHFMRQDPTDNQYGECEYEDRALTAAEYETKHEVLELMRIPREGLRRSESPIQPG